MISIYNFTDRKKVATLEKATDVFETGILNGISELAFKLPFDDPKSKYCLPYQLIKVKGGNVYYRFLDSEKEISLDSGMRTFYCEHVIATLIDDIVPGTVEYNNLTTAQNIDNVLNMQVENKHWRLGKCEFTRRFSYSWTFENLVSALFSIPDQFEEGYKWEFDTSSYPWTINLLKLDSTIPPEFYIMEGKNLISEFTTEKNSAICTRLYARGYGEGVNQLTFKSINEGKDYIEMPKIEREERGLPLISRIWVDRRFEVAENLLVRANVLLKEYSTPRMERTFSVADLEKITGLSWEKAEPGNVAKFEDFTTYVVSVKKHIDGTGPYELTLANEPEDIASSIANAADRQRINEVYANGNTFIYPQSAQGNAEPGIPLRLRVFVPHEVVNVNTAKLIWTLDRFRANSKTVSAGGAVVTTTSSGGSSTSSSGGGGTSSSGGAAAPSSSSGGGQFSSTSTNPQQGQTSNSAGQATVTSGASSTQTISINMAGSPIGENWRKTNLGFMTHDGNEIIVDPAHQHWVNLNHYHNIAHTHTVNTPAHMHTVTIPQHNHSFTVNEHAHTVSVPAHTHTISAHTHTIPAHTHSLTLGEHTHAIQYGIYEGPRASAVSITVDGNLVPVALGQTEVDILAYFKKDNAGAITRNTFHIIEIFPNSQTFIDASVAVQMFIQSVGGGNY